MTQAAMGNVLNISQRAYAHFEAGTRGIPIEVLISIAEFHEVSIDYIVGRTNRKQML